LYLAVKDLMTGRRFRVVDPEISARARPEDVLLSAILTLGRNATLLGAAAYTLPSDWRFKLVDVRRAYTESSWLTRDELVGMGAELCSEYRDAHDRDPLSMLATCGDAREPLHLRWTLSAPFSDAFDRLRPLTVCYSDGEAIDNEDRPEGEPSVLLTWCQRGPSADPDDWMMIGFLYLGERCLAADVPTGALATRLMTEVDSRLGAAATLRETRPSLPTRVHARESSLCLVPE
jgi:hypothetical protein